MLRTLLLDFIEFRCDSAIQANLTALAAPSFDGQPDGLTSVFGFDNLLLQAVQPDAAVKDFAYLTVTAYEDATLGIFRAVARMDADALPFAVELWATKQDGKPLLELW